MVDVGHTSIYYIEVLNHYRPRVPINIPESEIKSN
jgi:hypothetical protein